MVSELFLTVRGITTSVLKCGDIDKSNTLALIIPGNPGVALYYKEFMRVLHEASGRRLPVWCVSHAGHGSVPDFTTTETRDPFGLQSQIQHKISFVRDLVPADTRLLLIGHSIGCYVILHMLSAIDASRVVKCCMLFPTIERMAVSETGRKVTPLLKYFRWCLPLPLYGTYFTPTWLLESVFRWYFRGRNVPDAAIEATQRLANAFSVGNVLHMANQEMYTVVRPNYDIVEEHVDKIMFYYGPNDHWCPLECYEDMKARFPDSRDVLLCRRNFGHAFVLENSDGMGQYLWKWAEEHLKPYL